MVTASVKAGIDEYNPYPMMIVIPTASIPICLHANDSSIKRIVNGNTKRITAVCNNIDFNTQSPVDSTPMSNNKIKKKILPRSSLKTSESSMLFPNILT